MKKSAVVALATAALLVLSSCSGDGSTDSVVAKAPAGDPVSGGVLRAIEQAPIAGFDPVQAFSSTSTPMTFSALYGDFMVPNAETGENECNMCESFTTDDMGATFTVALKDGIAFSDGTPFNAEAVKFNWDRMKNPANGSASAGYASQVAEIKIVDDLTLQLVMTEQNPSFVANFVVYAMQWIASPAAIEKGTAAFNENPIGAGPFTLDSWTPNGVTKLVRNDNYWEEGLPYLDGMELRGVTDGTQRLNALVAGDVDAVMNSEASIFKQAESAGFENQIYTFNGGTGLMFNTSKAPFDDVRARQAVSYGLDLEALSDAGSGGYPEVPKTLFPEDNPLFSDIPLTTHNPEKAQELFDELAAEGKPLNFKFALFPGAAAQGAFDSLQGQLKAYDNVTVTAEQHDSSLQGVLGTTGDFQVLVSSLAFTEPSGRLWGALYSTAGASNYSRFNDPVVDAALDAANATDDKNEELAQYKIVQERLAEQVPYILYSSYYNGLVTNGKVEGALMYGYTTPRAAGIWMQQ